jgi:hypothetical protein
VAAVTFPGRRRGPYPATVRHARTRNHYLITDAAE